MRKKLFLILLVCTFSLVTFTLASAEEPQYGGILNRDLGPSDVPTLDPAYVTDTSSAEVARQIFDGLVEYDIDGNVIPMIAKSWEPSEGGLSWTFYLRDDVYFQDSYGDGTPTKNGGRQVTAHDFVWSWNRVIDPATKSPRAGFFEHIDKFEALDDFTFKITLKQPFTPFLALLAYNCFYVLPKEDVEAWGEDFTFHPVGSGAFRFKEWRHDEYIDLVANENYFKGRPYLDGARVSITSDEDVRFLNLKMGDLDFGDIPDPHWDATWNDPQYKKLIVRRPVLGVYYIGFNVTMEPFTGEKGKLLRKAFNYAIDREFIVNVIRRGRATIATGILPPVMPAFNPDLKGYGYNPEKAMELLAQAGYPNGEGLETIELWHNTSASHRRITEAIQDSLKEIGVDVKLNNLDWGAYIEKVDQGGFQMFRLGWIADYPDPENFLTVLLHSKNRGPGGNGAFYSNPEVDALLDKADVETDQVKRTALYRQAEEMIMDDAPWMPIYYYQSDFFVNPWLKEFAIPSMGIQDLAYRQLWIDESAIR